MALETTVTPREPTTAPTAVCTRLGNGDEKLRKYSDSAIISFSVTREEKKLIVLPTLLWPALTCCDRDHGLSRHQGRKWAGVPAR